MRRLSYQVHKSSHSFSIKLLVNAVVVNEAKIIDISKTSGNVKVHFLDK